MNIKLRYIIKRIFIFVGVLFVIGLATITKVDEEDYKSSSFYNTTIDRLDSLDQALQKQSQGQLSVGWGKANITPSEPVRLTGKNWSPYEKVFDSVYVRTFIFSNGSQKVAVISYDLWIMHPHLANAVKDRIAKSDLGITGTYFTANHSHTSIGGWATGLLGTAAVGGNHPETVTFIGDQTLEALNRAQEQLKPAISGYGEASTVNMVANRLDATAPIDEKLRFLRIRNHSNEQAIFTTFSAHSIFMVKGLNTLSADYPGSLTQALEASNSLEFASFSPGATGSHTPTGRKPFEFEKMQMYGKILANVVLTTQQHIAMDTSEILKYIEWPVELRSPHFRIANHWRLRPWLFRSIMGKQSVTITGLRVGNTVLVGLPVELSGEFSRELEQICEKRGLSLIITSFNGNYIGYVNPDRYYYTLNKPETREMNWYGPQNGEYFVDLIKELIAII